MNARTAPPMSGLVILTLLCLPSVVFAFGGLSTENQTDGLLADAQHPCNDSHTQCAAWAAQKQCQQNSAYMTLQCRLSCGLCKADNAFETRKRAEAVTNFNSSIVPFHVNPPSPSQQCVDNAEVDCEGRMQQGHCDSHKSEMLLSCPRSCGVCPYWSKLSKAYDCADQHENCKLWASSGECIRNPEYMLDACATSCGTCEEKRTACDRPVETPPLVGPGGINATFTRLLRDFPQYSPEVISMPGNGPKGARSPWLVLMRNFISDEEAGAFVSTCEGHFNRSLAGDQLSPVRTSNQCWCSHPECENNKLTRAVGQRISEVTGAPIRYMEPFQVLRYERGQFYKTHHDQNAASFTPQGPRVYTFYMYLSTPESGGGTRFNDLGVTVPAVKGSAVLWPSVQSDDPTRDEPFTNHESVSVERGVKYGANIWVHNFDYRTPASKNCVLTHMNTHG